MAKAKNVFYAVRCSSVRPSAIAIGSGGSLQDAKRPADVETAIVLGLRLAVDQNAGDEKSGENKEEVHPGPTAHARGEEQAGWPLEF
jgi:hypothetical protein